MARQRSKSLVVFSSGDPDYRFMLSNLGKLGFLFNFVLLCLFSLVIDVVVWIFISICYSILLICSSGTRVFGFCHVNAKLGFGWICRFFFLLHWRFELTNIHVPCQLSYSLPTELQLGDGFWLDLNLCEFDVFIVFSC